MLSNSDYSSVLWQCASPFDQKELSKGVMDEEFKFRAEGGQPVSDDLPLAPHRELFAQRGLRTKPG